MKYALNSLGAMADFRETHAADIRHALSQRLRRQVWVDRMVWLSDYAIASDIFEIVAFDKRISDDFESPVSSMYRCIEIAYGGELARIYHELGDPCLYLADESARYPDAMVAAVVLWREVADTLVPEVSSYLSARNQAHPELESLFINVNRRRLL